VFANDISEASHKLMQDNFELNNLDKEKVQMTLEDANSLMLKSRPMG
jgi:tRNA G26 N,N-dimethylase Trm1